MRLATDKIEVDKENRNFKPSIEWMRERYDQMNQFLFDGELGDCSFEIFTKGKGSEGRTLGYFQMRAPGLKANRRTGRMYREGIYGMVEVDRSNFVKLCNPTIALNGNYTGAEYGFLVTLIHEMCHYFTYMHGKAPGRGHGPEFYHIGEAVSSKANNLFTIQRLASAEQMDHLELSNEMKAKKEKRLANKKASIYAVFDYRSGGEVRLSTTNSQQLIDNICNFKGRNFVEKVVITNDTELIDFLFSLGYKKNFRTWRYWNVGNQPWLSKLDNISDKQVIKNPDYMNENIRKKSKDEIITEVINKFINEREGNDFVDITPDMNLGLYSPFEME
jgi:hypothetical protein